MKRLTILGLAGLLALTSCGGTTSSTTTDAADPTTTAPTTTVTTTSTTTAPTTTQPATPETNLFAVPFSMPRPEGWGFTEVGDFVVEMQVGGSMFLIFTTAGPPDTAGWLAKLQNDPNLEVTEPIEAQLGSASGVMLEAELSEGATTDPECEEPCALFFEAAPTPDTRYGWFLYEGFRERIWLVDVEGETVAVFAEAPTGAFSEFLAEVEAALGQLVWAG